MAASLPDLAAVSSLSRYVTRILGQNPSKFTLQGTNSYLVHHPDSTRMILIDTTGPSSSEPLSAPSLSTYLSSLRSVLDRAEPPSSYVSDVILTHWHRDHTAALPDVLRLLDDVRRARGKAAMGEAGDEEGERAVRVWKMPCAGDGVEAWANEAGKDAELERELARGADAHGGRDEGGVASGARVRPLQDGQRFRLGPQAAAGDDSSVQASADAIELEVVHTPGHTSDSICLVLHRVAPAQAVSAPPGTAALAVLTADTILGHGTAVFSSLSSYLHSLTRLLSLLPEKEGLCALYPGHGDVVRDGVGKIKEYRAHRLERERQILAALQDATQEPGAEGVTAQDLVEQIYGSTIPDSLKPAAAHGCLLHLAKLLEEGRVERISRRGQTAVGTGESREASGKGAAGEQGEVQMPRGWSDGWVARRT